MQSAGKLAYSVTLVGSASDTEGYVMIFIGNSWRPLATLDGCTCRGGVPSAWLPGRSGSLQQHKGIQVRDCLFDIIIISAGQINLLVRYIYTELIILMDVYSMYVLLVSYHHRPCKLPSKLGIPLIGKGTR